MPFPATKVRLVATDMDGTLLNSQHSVSSRTLSAIASVTSNHPTVPFVICTGRAPHAAKNIPISRTDNTLAIHTGGCMIVRYDKDPAPSGRWYTILHEEFVAPTDFIWYSDFAERTGRTLIFYSGDETIAASTHGHFHWLTEHYGEPPVTIPTSQEDLRRNVLSGDLKVHKLVFMDAPDVIPTIRDELKNLETPPSTVFLITQPDCLEVLPAGVNKATALRTVCKSYNVELDGVLAFGDALNDLEMIGEVGMGVAVGNAVEAVKKVAKLVCERTNNEDAVAVVLEEVFGFGEGGAGRV
ncbi:hypothetical protein HK104_001637 [Borealophlyctis nickersoniae]|nr:hypothetical protein HK104_001637 [Borealophlyctis nickersoniae]